MSKVREGMSALLSRYLSDGLGLQRALGPLPCVKVRTLSERGVAIEVHLAAGSSHYVSEPCR